MEWTREAEEALQSLKRYLASPPILVALAEKETLLLCIAATNQVISAVLVVERDTPPKESSKTKGKRPENSSPGQPGKKRRPGDLNAPTTPAGVESPFVEEGEPHSKGPLPGATSPTPQGAKDMEEAEPDKDSATRKVQHPVYFISSVLRDARE